MPDQENLRQLNLPVTSRMEVVEGGAPQLVTGGNGGGTLNDSSSSGGAEKPVEKPFILSEGLPPVPYKLVSRILRGEYVDMAELLRDNLEAQRRAAASATTAPQPSVASKSRREVPDIMSWVQCFGVYMAVVTSKFPERTKELLAYQTLIVREARRCGGKGWLAYDAHFRQQTVGDAKADWSKLNQSLYAVTFVAQGERDKNKSCILCLESDHSEEQCALYTPPQRALKLTHAARRGSADQVTADFREASAVRSRGSSRLPCFDWNQGECRFHPCKYHHSCVRCGGDHRVSRCPLLKSVRENKSQDGKKETEKRQ